MEAQRIASVMEVSGERSSNAEAEEVEEEIHARGPSPLPFSYSDLAELQARLLAPNREEQPDTHDGEMSHSSAQLSAAMTDLAMSLGESSIEHGGSLGEMQRTVRKQQAHQSSTGNAAAGSQQAAGDEQVAELHARGFAPLAAALASGRVRFPLHTDIGETDDDEQTERVFMHHHPPQHIAPAPAARLSRSFSANSNNARQPSALEVPSLSRSRSGSSDSSGSDAFSLQPNDRLGSLRTGNRSVAPSRRGVPPPCPGVSKWRKPPSPSEDMGSEGVMADLGAEMQRPGGNWRSRRTPASAPANLGVNWPLPANDGQ